MASNFYIVDFINWNNWQTYTNTIFANKQFDAQFFSCMFISILYGQPCAHHQENELYQYDIWYKSLCIDGRLVCRFGSQPNLQTKRSSIQSDIYQISYWYN